MPESNHLVLCFICASLLFLTDKSSSVQCPLRGAPVRFGMSSLSRASNAVGGRSFVSLLNCVTNCPYIFRDDIWANAILCISFFWMSSKNTMKKALWYAVWSLSSNGLVLKLSVWGWSFEMWGKRIMFLCFHVFSPQQWAFRCTSSSQVTLITGYSICLTEEHVKYGNCVII